MDVVVQINNQIPIMESGVQLELNRKGNPGQLTFSVLKDAPLDFAEGNPVKLFVDGKGLFFGFVFKKKRNKNGLISVTAYDQLRYLKNKDTMQYENKTASELIWMIAEDFRLEVGDLEDSGFRIAKRKEDNKTLMDIIQMALEITVQNTGQLFVLYDDMGKLTLRDIGSLELDLLIDEETAEDFDYTSSIDGDTYNKIKLSRDNEDTGKRDIYIVQSGDSINAWGVLQYYESIQDNVNAQAKADTLLELYNQKTRELTVKGAFGDTRVRGGSLLGVALNLGDLITNNYMLVERVKHVFSEGQHTMDLNLRGGVFNA